MQVPLKRVEPDPPAPSAPAPSSAPLPDTTPMEEDGINLVSPVVSAPLPPLPETGLSEKSQDEHQDENLLDTSHQPPPPKATEEPSASSEPPPTGLNLSSILILQTKILS